MGEGVTTMTDVEMLRAAVIRDPDDIAARYAFADACEEAGLYARATFTRMQLTGVDGKEFANDNFALITTDVPHFLKRSDVTLHYVNGFIEDIHCPMKLWRRHGVKLVLRHPVRKMMTDREPLYRSNGEPFFVVGDEYPDNMLHALPQRIYTIVMAALAVDQNLWPSEACAELVGRASIQWAREEAGLCDTNS